MFLFVCVCVLFVHWCDVLVRCIVWCTRECVQEHYLVAITRGGAFQAPTIFAMFSSATPVLYSPTDSGGRPQMFDTFHMNVRCGVLCWAAAAGKVPALFPSRKDCYTLPPAVCWQGRDATRQFVANIPLPCTACKKIRPDPTRPDHYHSCMFGYGRHRRRAAKLMCRQTHFQRFRTQAFCDPSKCYWCKSPFFCVSPHPTPRVDVGWQRRCKTRRSLRELDTRIFFVVTVSIEMVIEFYHIVVEGLKSVQGGLLYHVVCTWYMVRQFHSTPCAAPAVAVPENTLCHSMPSFICQKVRARCRSPPHKRFLGVERSSPFLRLTEHRTALRAWCKQRRPGRWKPDMLLPGNVGMRGSNSYGLKTTVMHGHDYFPPPLPGSRTRIVLLFPRPVVPIVHCLYLPSYRLPGPCGRFSTTPSPSGLRCLTPLACSLCQTLLC